MQARARQRGRLFAECMRVIPQRLQRRDVENIVRAVRLGRGPFAGKWVVVGDFGWCDRSKAAMRLVCERIGRENAVLLHAPFRLHDRHVRVLARVFDHGTVPLVIDDAGRYLGGADELESLLSVRE